MEYTRSERARAFAETHAKVRAKEGKSQEFMAMELGVSKKTIQNWEKGISSPTFFQSLEWFRILNTNPFPYYLELTYPDQLKGLKGTDDDKKIIEAFGALSDSLPISAKRALLYIFYGEHGSSPNAIIQLILAHLHLPLKDRVSPATIVVDMFEMEKELGNLICKDNIMPDMDVLNDAIHKARISVIHNDAGYNNIK